MRETAVERKMEKRPPAIEKKKKTFTRALQTLGGHHRLYVLPRQVLVTNEFTRHFLGGKPRYQVLWT